MTADAYVYLLSDYDESGSDNVVATLYRANLASLVDINWPDSRFHLPAHGPELRAEAKKKLAAHLEKTDEDLAAGQKWACSDGWGGIQLHVVKLT